MVASVASEPSLTVQALLDLINHYFQLLIASIGIGKFI